MTTSAIVNHAINISDLYRGFDIKVNDYIKIHHPTVGEVFDGDTNLLSVVTTLCATPTDLAWQLEKHFKIDFVTADDYEVFVLCIAPTMPNSKTSLLLGNVLDFTKMKAYKLSEDSDEIILKQHIINEKEIPIDDKKKIFSKKSPIATKTEVEEYDIVFDRFTYAILTDYLRKLFGLEKNAKKPGNKGARKYLINESKRKVEEAEDKPQSNQSHLLNLISFAVNSEGFKHDEITVFNMRYYPFLDSIKRLQKIFHVKALYQSGYSGFGVDLSKIGKSNLDMMGDLE